MVAFVLFGYLSAIRVAFGMGVDVAGADRMLVIHKVSLIQPLPESYLGRVAAIDGVADVSHMTWFGGIYQDPRNFFAQFAVEPESYLRLYPELELTEEEKRRWLANRTGAVVDRATAERFGWSVGDRVPLQGTIWRTRSGPRVGVHHRRDHGGGDRRRRGAVPVPLRVPGRGQRRRTRLRRPVHHPGGRPGALGRDRGRRRLPLHQLARRDPHDDRAGLRCRAWRTSSGTSGRC